MYCYTTAYKFLPFEEEKLEILRDDIKKAAKQEEDLKGTILLSTEGINMFLCGTNSRISEFKEYIQDRIASKLTFKESQSKKQCFTRMLVKIKREIISMGVDSIHPEIEQTAPHLQPETFKHWYEAKEDMLVLDTRNLYEVELGTFEGAQHLNIATFRDFSEALDQLPEEAKSKKIVTFCTGGIRCEKAAPLMIQKGFHDVHQLEGGIINYFEKCGGNFWNGECYVFDKRVALDCKLEETDTIMCFSCRHPISPQKQKGQKCPFCGDTLRISVDQNNSPDNHTVISDMITEKRRLSPRKSKEEAQDTEKEDECKMCIIL